MGYGVDATLYQSGTTSTNVQVCFAAGETTHLEGGVKKFVELIEADDMIMAVSHDDPFGEPRPCRVVRVFKNPPQRVWQVTIRNSVTNDTQTIRVTGEHPFFVKERGWTAVRDLVSGDAFRNMKGEFTQVFVKKELEDDPVPVYNFEVEGAHTYFVGENDDDAVLVHNECSICHSPAHGDYDCPNNKIEHWYDYLSAQKNGLNSAVAATWRTLTQWSPTAFGINNCVADASRSAEHSVLRVRRISDTNGDTNVQEFVPPRKIPTDAKSGIDTLAGTVVTFATVAVGAASPLCRGATIYSSAEGAAARIFPEIANSSKLGRLVLPNAGKNPNVASDLLFAKRLVDEGFEVTYYGNAQGADFMINGVKWELKTMTTASADQVGKAISKALESQSGHLLIDMTGSTVTRAEVEAMLVKNTARFIAKGVKEVRFIFKGETMVWKP